MHKAPLGCMQVDNEGASLRWPDYSGNWMFNTLGGGCLSLVPVLTFILCGCICQFRVTCSFKAIATCSYYDIDGVPHVPSGNIVVNPMAGLLFVDWLSGNMLQITGAALGCGGLPCPLML